MVETRYVKSNQLEGDICDVSFGYNSKKEGYTTLMSDIPTLYAVDFETPI
jgi:hypothetical protein